MSRHITFAGLELRNPIIAASSNRTNSAEYNHSLEQAGVGAIVLKSLFEENIIRQCEAISSDADHAEGGDYLQGYLRSNELSEYIHLIEQSKSACTVPIIASVNCVSTGEWTEFASLIEKAGADALELNIMGIEADVDYNYGDFEQRHIEILKSVVNCVKIPVIVKLGSMLTNPVALIEKLKAYGAAAVVLFNRMYQPDINIDNLEYTSANVLSSAQDLALPLRWVGIASSKVKGINYALSGGVQDGKDVIKAILAGATAIEVCSVLYRENINLWLENALDTMDEWQAKKGYENPMEYCGKMNADCSEKSEKLARNQFLRYFGSLK